MNPAEIAARGHCTRTPADIEADLQLACRTIGSLAGAARLNAAPVDRVALRNALAGVRALLAERGEGAQ